jgi:4-amino-4-deoxy-L-arabinose transferase-like glycosyltransferase
MQGDNADHQKPAGFSRFAWWVTAAAGVGAAIRTLYVANYPSRAVLYIGGDGLDYHLMSLRLANGEGYVNGLTGVGQNAHHPPGWVTFLAGMVKLGAESPVAQQRVGIAIGTLLIVVVAVLAAKMFGERTGVVAGFLAAIYPGFWVLDAQILAEPLALVLLGVLFLLIYRLVESPTFRLASLIGVSLGIAILVRSEQAAVFVIVIPLALARARGLARSRRVQLGAVIGVIAVSLMVPWAAYNSTRFEEPVLLSSNFGSTLLAGNCSTFSGEFIGFYDTSCNRELTQTEKPADRSVQDRLARGAAIDNILDNTSRLPLTMLARMGRTVGLYAPGQTVEAVAEWNGTSEWPVWFWVVSFWPLAALAVFGSISTRRSEVWQLPLLVPIVLAAGIVLVFYGEPRYHTPADLSIVILAAVGLVRLTNRGPESIRRGET